MPTRLPSAVTVAQVDLLTVAQALLLPPPAQNDVIRYPPGVMVPGSTPPTVTLPLVVTSKKAEPCRAMLPRFTVREPLDPALKTRLFMPAVNTVEPMVPRGLLVAPKVWLLAVLAAP